MLVTLLKQKLQAASTGTFTLAAGDLGVAGVESLLKAHLGGGDLTISGARPDLDELSVEGTASVDSMRDRPVKVWFSTDKDAVNVTGLLIAYQSSGWSLATSFLKFTGDYLKDYSFTSLALVLSARPEDDTATTYGVGVGVYVGVASKSLFLHACLPPKERDNNQTSDIRLQGDFRGTPLGDLGLLASFVSGYNFTGLLPSTIPLADQFALRSATFVVNPNLKFVVAVVVEVRSAHPWVLVEDKFQFDYLDITFTINTPGAGTTVYWDLKSEMKIGDSVEVIAEVDSGLNLSAELGEPVPIKPILSRYFPAAALDFTVDTLDIYLAFGERPPGWGFDLAVESGWTLFDKVALRSVALSATGRGASPDNIKIKASLDLGDAKLFLGGEMNKGAGWDFSGRMTHDYSVQIVPNEAFDPGQPGSNPLKSVTVNNNVSHFFGMIFDKLFPGSGASGVPPLIDLNIKTLGVEFNTQTKDFHFDTDIEFGKDVEATLTFANLHQAGAQSPTFEKRATGVIKVFPGKPNEFAFDLGIDLKPNSKHFVALYNNTAGKAINLGDLVRTMFPDIKSLPLPNFDITIKDAIVGYISDKQSDKTVSQSVFALDMGASIDLSSLGDIPLIGRSLSAAKTLKLALQLVYPARPKDTAPIATADLVALNSLITVAGPSFPVDQVLSELFVKTELRIGDGKPIDFKLPVVINSNGQLANTDKPFNPPPGAQATDDGVKWFQLNTQFGPVHLQRAGFKFDKGEVTALLDGGLAALGLEVDLMGLSVTSKITDVKDGEFHPRFGLQGLGLSFSKGGVGLAGALLHLEVTRDGQTVNEYDGLASVEAEGLRLAAIGSLTKVNKQTSLFLFAVLDYPLGGEPFFYVTGLAGGFGLNQKLVMPAVDQVRTFPLIDAALNPPKVPTDAGSAGPFITAEMQKLHTYLTSSVGQYFGCAGIRFNSFELLDSFVLVSLSFGREFELDLLGMSTLVVPPELPPSEPALAKVSLQIVASFIPNEGLAIVQGRLTADSHILDPNCHLTGGFAFATWFGANPHAGDFVITLGGYHPDFQKPGHYPTVPRVGINWQITPQLGVTGGLYFALTPRALMAGGAMRAVFQTSIDLSIASVDVKAWFILGADFIVYWKPFHYSAHLYIDIGIDVVIHFLGTHDLGFDAGADLQVWGPAFGGHAHVFIKVIGIKIGFDVDFGAAAPKPPPLKWDDRDDASKSFRKSFLPPDDKIVSVAIGEGLVRKVDIGKEGRGGGALVDEDKSDVWFVINASDFCVRTSSVIPIKDCTTTIPQAGKKTLLSDVASNTDFGIASMGKDKDKVKTSHRIAVVKRDGQPAESHFVAHPIHSHVPGGLWAENNSADINAELLIERAVVGFEIVPAKTSVPGHTQPIKRDCLTYTTHDLSNAYADHAIATFTATGSNPGDDPAKNRALWDSIQGEIHLNTTRDAMLAAMGFANADFDIGEPFSTDATYAPSYGSLGR